MPATIVVGGQYGSEGKGKVVALTAAECERPYVVRCGGPNSGHTTCVDGVERVLRQLPAAAGNSRAMLLIAAGCAVDEDILFRELDECRVARERIIVDPRAVLVSDYDRENEAQLTGEIGSTGSGTGSALIRRMSRSKDIALVADSNRLRNRVRIADVAPILHDHLDDGGDVIIEGTQGFGLSILHGPHYPYVTARDTTAAGFAAEVGLSPRQVDEIILVIRTFPIRVGGPSGPLPDEITWEEVRKISGAREVQSEFTSVTRRLRRVARFDLELVRLACQYNRPTALAVMGLDRLDIRNCGQNDITQLTGLAIAFIAMLEAELQVPVTWMGTGFGTSHAIANSKQICELLNHS